MDVTDAPVYLLLDVCEVTGLLVEEQVFQLVEVLALRAGENEIVAECEERLGPGRSRHRERPGARGQEALPAKIAGDGKVEQPGEGGDAVQHFNVVESQQVGGDHLVGACRKCTHVCGRDAERGGDELGVTRQRLSYRRRELAIGP